MESLSELTSEYQRLLDMSDGLDDDDKQAFLDTLEGIDYEVGLKADSYATVMTAISSRIDMHDAEIKRLQERKKALENNLDRMKSALLEAMHKMGKKEVEGKYHKFKEVKNGGKAPVIYTDEIPDTYKKLVFEDDKERIRKDLEAGAELNFAYLGERGTHLKID